METVGSELSSLEYPPDAAPLGASMQLSICMQQTGKVWTFGGALILAGQRIAILLWCFDEGGKASFSKKQVKGYSLIQYGLHGTVQYSTVQYSTG